VDTNYLTPAASISTTSSGNVVENDFRDILESMGRTSGMKDEIMAFMGPKAKRKFADFQFYLPSSTVAAAQTSTGVVFHQDSNDKTILRSVDTYQGDFGPVKLQISWWMANLTGSATVQNYRTYFLRRDMWELRWNQKPKVYKPEFKGGSYEAAMDAICMLVCKNPLGEGKWAPTA
jgi:hypothetical protein